MVTHSSILAWRIPGRKSLVGYSPRGRKESDWATSLTNPSCSPAPSCLKKKKKIHPLSSKTQWHLKRPTCKIWHWSVVYCLEILGTGIVGISIGKWMEDKSLTESSEGFLFFPPKCMFILFFTASALPPIVALISWVRGECTETRSYTFSQSSH